MVRYGGLRGRDSRRGGSRRGGGRYDYGRSRRGKDDDYEDEEVPYYGEPTGGGQVKHEDIALYIFIGAGALILIVLIITFAVGGSGEASSAFTNPLAGYGADVIKKEKEIEKIDSREQDSMKAFQDALQYYRANEYEDKEDLLPKFEDVIRRFPNTRGAEEAQKWIAEIQARQR
jgi:hypothetical protein